MLFPPPAPASMFRLAVSVLAPLFLAYPIDPFSRITGDPTDAILVPAMRNPFERWRPPGCLHSRRQQTWSNTLAHERGGRRTRVHHSFSNSPRPFPLPRSSRSSPWISSFFFLSFFFFFLFPSHEGWAWKRSFSSPGVRWVGMVGWFNEAIHACSNVQMIILFQLLALVINKMVYICWMETLNISGTNIKLGKRNWTTKMIVSSRILSDIDNLVQ